MQTTLTLYPFAYFDAITRKWHRARYVATLDDIGTRYGPFKITGAPELREITGEPVAWFRPPGSRDI